MARFNEKNGECMEEKNNVQIDPNDTITWIKYVIKGQPTKRSNIPEYLWTKAIGSDPCFGEKEFEAMIDICHIIGEWYNVVVEDYNRGQSDDRKFEYFGHLYDQHFKDARVKVRFTNTLRNYGMNVQDKQDALKLLDIAPDQPQGFQKAFEGCVRWFYRRN
ncbi:4629_t:CDS:2 [Funneliformis caledonium]|uniref:4629_t:CDS:1 n=1 Tax=Funneliformis caledonium TaxID=1117310 RepID=A0A9N9DVK3_9GLOM|nr:4629_t:CDS:2 [Funneliformis caledonium]